MKLAVILYLFLRFFIVLCSDVEEGSSCVLNDGNEGVCLKLSDCQHTSNDIKEFVFPKFCSLSLWQPLVCCPDCKFIQNRFLDDVSVNLAFKILLEFQMTVSAKTNYELTEYKRKHTGCLEAFLIQHFPCNKYEQFRDLDNSIRCYDISLETEDDELERNQVMTTRYPHLALIGYGDNPNNAQWVCSGSIISDKYILTAAHCTFVSPELGERKFAALGTQQWPDDRRYWQIYNIVQIIIHPDYVPPSKSHDIALLETGTKIIYNIEVIPACLQREENMAEVVTAIGWDAIGHQKQPAEILKGVDILKLSHKECMEAFPKHRHLTNGYSSNIQACYGDRDSKNDICKGDRGGPLQIDTKKKKAKCLHTIIGVTSYGRACGFLGTAGLYTRIAPYVPWIESITGSLS